MGKEKIFPPEPLRALTITDLKDVKVVILGQDPYHGEGQANGLAFSVASDVRKPPSLKNIFKEIERSVGATQLTDGDLTPWAEQGVLLLNTSLTVEEGKPASHAKIGWNVLTDKLIELIASQDQPIVFMLWGKHAQNKKALIEKAGKGHLILESNHPSPLSAMRGPVPFMGNNHFRLANDWLSKQGLRPIVW